MKTIICGKKSYGAKNNQHLKQKIQFVPFDFLCVGIDVTIY